VSAVSWGSLSSETLKERIASIFRVKKLERVDGELMVAKKYVCYVGRFVGI